MVCNLPKIHKTRKENLDKIIESSEFQLVLQVCLVVEVLDIRERLQEENHGRQEFNVEFLLVRDEVNQNVETTGLFEILQRSII